MTIIVYGIPNCDTVRKARKWLEQQAIDYQFHDVRAEPVPATTIDAWINTLGIDTVINKRSTAWRALSTAEQQLTTPAQAVALLQQHPTLMKRPLLTAGEQMVAGFQPEQWQQALPRG